MSSEYEQKQESKKARFLAKAEKLKSEAERRFSAADLREERSGIPLGQPILVGHHSERRHRKALERADANMRKGVEAEKKAAYYLHKAEGMGGSISSDDPEAILKLQEKLNGLEDEREALKDHNKKAKKEGQEILPSYVLSNLGANIRTVKKRIAALTREQEGVEAAPVQEDGYRIEESKKDNRIRILFDAKPDKGVRDMLKRNGFRWAPSVGAWQRHLNNSGRYAALNVKNSLTILAK